MNMSLRAPESQPTKNTLRALRLCGRLTEKVSTYYCFPLWNEYHSIFRKNLFLSHVSPYAAFFLGKYNLFSIFSFISALFCIGNGPWRIGYKGGLREAYG